MNIAHAPLLVACLAFTACSTSPRHSASDDSTIGTLTDSQRAEIDEARAQQDRRGDELAAARQDIVRAKAQCTVARKDLDLMNAQVDKAKAVVAVAETGTSSDLEKAREELRQAEQNLGAQRDLIRWRECEVTRAEKAEIVADRMLAVAAANVELEKARAIAKTDQASAGHVDLVQRETDLRECQTQVSHAKVELEAAARECAVAKEAYDTVKASAK